MKLPPLYKKTKTGAIQLYLVESDENNIMVSQGQVDGKMQSYFTQCEPKNVGRANETSAAEQAASEAQSKWNKKVKAGYTEDPSGEISVKLPMKVKVYQDNIDNVILPAFVSPKLDGVNAIYRLEGSRLTLWSRGGDEYPAIPHLEEHVRLLMSTLKCKELNGELYIPNNFLQDITGAVKKTKELSKQLEFHVFDIPDHPGTYEERFKLLLRANVHSSRPVKIVGAYQADTHDYIDEFHDICVDDGYEGIVIRNARGLYKYNERSSDVFKKKIPKDAEFQIVDFNIDKNGHPVFICTIDGTKTFKVKMIGTDEIRKGIAANAQDYLGKWLTIEFETYSKDGVPLKPVGKNFRECSSQGEPVE